VAPGANGALTLDDDDRARIRSADVVLTNHEISNAVVVQALTVAHAEGRTAILNPAPARALSADVLHLGPILTPNEHELIVAIGNDTTEAALDDLVARHAGPIVVTQGPAGALLARGDQRRRFDGRPAGTVVDTTGAGDTFNGVLSAWLADGASLEASIQAANVGAALSIGAAGARAGMPSREAIQAVLTEG
jgi:ribokinase